MKDLHRAAQKAAADRAEVPAHLSPAVNPWLAAALAGLLAACAQNPSAPEASAGSKPTAAPAVVMNPGWIQPLPPVPVLQGLSPAVITPTRMSQSLMERYQQAVQAQQQLMNSLMGR